MNVSTTSACSWTASSNASWITITSGASGSGNGSLAYSFAANTGDSRTGTLTIAGQTYTVTQEACSYVVAPDTLKVDESGGARSVTVSTASTCTWRATSADSWITITGSASGTGNGTVTVSVARNTAKKRSGTLTVAGHDVKVEQDKD